MVRLAGFREAHPDIEITAPDYGNGGRMWSAHRGGRVLCAEHELRDLLDDLDSLIRGAS